MTDQTEKAVVLTAEMARAHLAYVKELQIALWSRVGNLPTVPLLVAAHDAIEAIASGRAVVSEAGAPFVQHAIGFMYAYACTCADKGIDIRTLELPAIYEEYQRATRSPA